MIGEKSRGWGPVWVNRNSGLEKFWKERNDPSKEQSVRQNSSETGVPKQSPIQMLTRHNIGNITWWWFFVHSMAFERADYFISHKFPCPLSLLSQMGHQHQLFSSMVLSKHIYIYPETYPPYTDLTLKIDGGCTSRTSATLFKSRQCKHARATFDIATLVNFAHHLIF
jgi:hypothetical protein